MIDVESKNNQQFVNCNAIYLFKPNRPRAVVIHNETGVYMQVLRSYYFGFNDWIAPDYYGELCIYCGTFLEMGSAYKCRACRVERIIAALPRN